MLRPATPCCRITCSTSRPTEGPISGSGWYAAWRRWSQGSSSPRSRGALNDLDFAGMGDEQRRGDPHEEAVLDDAGNTRKRSRQRGGVLDRAERAVVDRI